MELMSAVRSVSCNSSMSKCKQGEEEEYGPGMEAPPIIDSLFIKVHKQSISFLSNVHI
jgi:hypothetical protein